MRITNLRESRTTTAMTNGSDRLCAPLTSTVTGQILDTVTVEAANK